MPYVQGDGLKGGEVALSPSTSESKESSQNETENENLWKMELLKAFARGVDKCWLQNGQWKSRNIFVHPNGIRI